MSVKFYGTRHELKTFLDKMGLPGDWEEITSAKVRYRFYNGVIINWWPTTKSLQFQGPQEAREKLKAKIQDLLLCG